MALQVGDVAPDFELPASGNHTIKLSDYRGKQNVLLAFFPFAFSPVCSLQLPGLQQQTEPIPKPEHGSIGHQCR